MTVICLLIAGILGMVMGIPARFTLAPVHAHLALVGWLSLAMAGVIYHLYPAAGQTRLARLHFWLHNVGLPTFMVALALALTGTEAPVPAIAGGAGLLLAGPVLFAINVLVRIRAG